MNEHLSYLKKPLEWYINEHMSRHEDSGRSTAAQPIYNMYQLLKENRFNEFKGVHNVCFTDEPLSCVMFAPKGASGSVEYYHTLYLGQGTNNPAQLELQILDELDLDVDDFERDSSLFAMCHL